MLVEITERLQSAGKDAGVIVIGDGPRRDEYVELSNRLTHGSVKFFGFVQPHEIAFYYAQADVLVVPSVSEPWGFVVNEALSCSLPVVCSPQVGAAYDLITEGETGFVCESVDEYVGVSNTNMHLRASAGRTARVLVPAPAEWRWMQSGPCSPWFPGFSIYRPSLQGDWANALAALRSDLALNYGSVASSNIA